MNLSFRFTTMSLLKLITTFAAIVYSALLFYIFFLARRRRGPTLPWRKRYLNLVPLKKKTDYFFSQSNVTMPQRQEFYLDLMGNILLFIPLSFLLCLIFRLHAPRKCILVSIMISISIELIQFLLSIGVADIDDMILNTTGAMIGVIFFRLFLKVDVFKSLAVAYRIHGMNAEYVNKK